MILITGATGNNGQELVRQLTAMGQRVRAFVRNPAEAARLKGPNIEFAVGDFNRPETLDAALQGVEEAFLLAAVAGCSLLWQTSCIEGAGRGRVEHVVKLSGMGPVPRSAPELLRLHGETDGRLGGSGVPFTILQPDSFHQNILS